MREMSNPLWKGMLLCLPIREHCSAAATMEFLTENPASEILGSFASFWMEGFTSDFPRFSNKKMKSTKKNNEKNDVFFVPVWCVWW